MGKSYVTVYSRYPVNIEGQVGGWIENVLKFESFGPMGLIFSAKVGLLLKLFLIRQARRDQQHAKKVVSDSPQLVDFAMRLVNFVLNLPDGQVKFLMNSNDRRTV